MKPKTLTMGLKRDVRHARFDVSQCSAQLTVEIEDDDDLEKVKDELHEALVTIVEDMIEEEKLAYKEKIKDENKDK